jgi:cytochrome P450 family 135
VKPVPRPFMPRPVGLVALKSNPIDFLERCRQRSGDVFELSFGTGLARTAWVCDPGLAEQIMQAPADELEAATANSLLQPIVGDGSLLLLAGADHIHRRERMLGEFGLEHRERDGDLSRETVEAHLGSWGAGDVFEPWAWARDLTMQIMLRIVFGLADSPRANVLGAALAEFVDATENPGIAFPMLRKCKCAISPWGRFLRKRKKAYGLIDEEIRRARADPLLATREDVLADLVRPYDHRELSTPMIRDELVTLMIAGKETAAGGIAWALELLLRNPTELRLLRDDLRNHPSKRLRAAVWEALRLRVPLFAIGRGAVRDYRLGDFTIPAGTAVAVPLPIVYQSPELFDEPTLYRPDRYLAPDPPPDWIPFGGGIRSCIGARFAPALIGIVLRAVFERFELELVDRDAPQITLRAAAFPVPKQTVRLRVRDQHAPAASALSPSAPGTR